MLEITWLNDPEIYFRGERVNEPLSNIIGYRNMEHADLPSLERLIRKETCEIFGNIDLGHVYETSCLSIVQRNEKQDIVSGICLCNYPNVPSVPSHDWLSWLRTLYGLENATESNALFIHFLAWDKRYTGQFFADLLTGLFDVASYLVHAILVLPPQVIPADTFEQQMIRILAKDIAEDDTYSTQSLYVSARYLENPRLKIRRVVEEDNDDVIPIIDAETSRLKEFYGEYYISEMVRYSEHFGNHRQIIVSEDDDGLATGVMFLNESLDVDILNENFELDAYNGLKKPCAENDTDEKGKKPASEIFYSVFSSRPEGYESNECENKGSIDTLDNVHEKGDTPRKGGISGEGFPNVIDVVDRSVKDESQIAESLMDTSQIIFPSDALVPSSSVYSSVYHQSHEKMRTSTFADAVFDVPQRNSVPIAEVALTAPTKEIREATTLYPKYHGTVNAFALEVFATEKGINDRWSRNFLEAAFECFPDLDYCTILLPFPHPSFPLLEHFARVPVRCNKDFPMTLHVAHRAVLLSETNCRKATPQDRDDLLKLLRNIPKMVGIIADYDEAMKENHRPELNCYVFQCNGTIIGLIIFCIEKHCTFIRRRYHIEDYVAVKNLPQDTYGRILHFATMPIFSVSHRFFFREIMRLTGLTVFYYRLSESAISALTRSYPLATCLSAMIPVNPRRRIEYKFRGYVETDEKAEGMNGEHEESFSLFLTTPRLVSLPTSSIIDMKIVVVGASDCGVAFAEFLALGSTRDFMHFINLTLISPHGLPFEKKCELQALGSLMIPFKGRYCEKYRYLVATRAWINVVYGTVIAIDRKKKHVSVMNQGNITYDYLILTCGLQYQKPRFQKEVDARTTGESIELQVPWNCLTINNVAEASLCLEKVNRLTNNLEEEKAIVFYGRNIDCYCALYGLLELGTKGSWITVIEPPLQQCETRDSIFFDDCEVNVQTMNGILRSGVNVLSGWTIVDWFLKETKVGTLIESIVLKSKGKTLTISCDALFNFHEKTIDTKIFLAICRAGLVFDGQLVIDPTCRTNDPFIFAAGTLTKYSRKFHAESWQHKYYSSIEVGERLAKSFQRIIDTRQREKETSVAPPRGKLYLTLPIFRSPWIVACTLPGGYHYLHVRKSGKNVLRSVAIRHDFYGEVMVTGSCTSDIGYFRLRLNPYDTVETITCFSKETFEVGHMVTLYGKHESMLNELKLRFRTSLISDFYAYFREPWATAIFYDRFECLRIENRATLLSKTAIPGDSLMNDCVQALIKSKWEAMSDEHRRYIQSRYAGSVYQRNLEDSLIDFLQFAEEDLPVYCTPGKLRWMYADIEDSPLFVDS